jgi:hypothetical protein
MLGNAKKKLLIVINHKALADLVGPDTLHMNEDPRNELLDFTGEMPSLMALSNAQC